MNSSDWLSAALQNNMDWYQVEANSWQLPYARTASNWWSAHTVPPFHSNLVTCERDPRRLIESINKELSHQWSIKDAHQQYNLASLGFETLFDALWYARDPKPWDADTAQVRCVGSKDELTQWINAWGETPAGKTVFVPRLLADPAVKFVYLAQDNKMSAGLVANLSAGAVGITNTFGPLEAIDQCMAFVANTHPTLGLVGYDRESEVRRLSVHGIEALGELRIWNKR